MEEDRLEEEARRIEEEERNKKVFAECGSGDEYVDLPDNEVVSVVMEEEIFPIPVTMD